MSKTNGRFKIEFKDGGVPDFLDKNYTNMIFDGEDWIFYHKNGTKTRKYKDEIVKCVGRV